MLSAQTKYVTFYITLKLPRILMDLFLYLHLVVQSLKLLSKKGFQQKPFQSYLEKKFLHATHTSSNVAPNAFTDLFITSK